MKPRNLELAGVRVLVVEDDFFLAVDEQSTLEEAGAQVVGPCADESAGLYAAQSGEIDCAVLDLNLGQGPSFRIPAVLRRRAIPFVFVSGYGAGVIPDEYSAVRRLQKPVVMHNLVLALHSALHPEQDQEPPSASRLGHVT